MPEESQYNHLNSDAAARRAEERSTPNSPRLAAAVMAGNPLEQDAIDREMEELRRLLGGQRRKTH